MSQELCSLVSYEMFSAVTEWALSELILWAITREYTGTRERF